MIILLKYKKKPIKKRNAPKKPNLPNVCPYIKPVQPCSEEVLTFMNGVNGQKKENTPNMSVFLEENAQNFKSLTLDNQLRVLFYYIKVHSRDGLFKRPALQTIGDYFGGTHKNTIKTRLKMLEDNEYIKTLTELELKEAKNTYKLLKDRY